MWSMESGNVDQIMHGVQNMAKHGLDHTQTPGWHVESRMEEKVEQIAHGVWNGRKHRQDHTWSPELGIHRQDGMQSLE